MNPQVVKVIPKDNFILHVFFKDKEQRLFDMKPYLDIGVFRALRNNSLFYSAKVEYGTVVWNENIDFDPDTIYLEGKLIRGSD